MEIIEKRITLEDPSEPLVVVPIGDVHYGNVNVDLKKFKETIEYIKNKPNCYTILMGDMCEAIMMSDKRFDVECIAPELKNRLGDLAFAQYENMRDMLMPIKNKILLSIRGNHGDNLRTKFNTDFDAWMAKELNVPMAGYSAFLVIKFDREQFHTETLTFFVHHGIMSSRKTGAKVNAIEGLAESFDADVYLNGHSHDLFVTSKVKLSVAGNKVKESKRYFAHTGTFLKTYVQDTLCYGEKALYPPLKTGVLKFSIYPRAGNIDIHVSE